MFTLKIETDNDAFQNGDREFEIRRILDDIDLDYNNRGIIYDINGNKVGSWELT